MRNALRFLLMFIASVLPLLSQAHMAESAEQNEKRVKGVIENCDADSGALQPKDVEDRGHFMAVRKASILAAWERFVDNGDGTITDTRRRIMWQKGDSGKEVTFDEAQRYCKTLRLGGYADWRLPKPDEIDTAVVIELMMPRHSPLPFVHFDLYWSSNSTLLLPFNYRPSYGAEVLRVYSAGKGARAFARAVRSLETAKSNSGS